MISDPLRAHAGVLFLRMVRGKFQLRTATADGMCTQYQQGLQASVNGPD